MGVLRVKKRFVILGGILILLAISIGMYLNVTNNIKHPLRSDIKDFIVKKGDTLYTVLDRLNGQDKLYNEKLVKLYIKQNNFNTTIKTGVYKFSKGITIEEFVHALNNGAVDKDVVMVTIPEGYNVDQIAKRLEEKEIIKKDDFLKACKEYQLRKYMKDNPSRRYALEGYLFPDTYELKKGMKGKDILDAMVNRFEFVIGEVEKQLNKTIDTKELDSIITMASVVEREVELSEERTIAASVFYNRIAKNMKLESCATILYADGSYGLKPNEKYISIQATKINSPYNTYLYSGLPVGPISCPGKECIIAALKPAKTNYFYFVSKDDGTGAHVFSETYEKHLAAQKLYQHK